MAVAEPGECIDLARNDGTDLQDDVDKLLSALIDWSCSGDDSCADKILDEFSAAAAASSQLNHLPRCSARLLSVAVLIEATWPENFERIINSAAVQNGNNSLLLQLCKIELLLNGSSSNDSCNFRDSVKGDSNAVDEQQLRLVLADLQILCRNRAFRSLLQAQNVDLIENPLEYVQSLVAVDTICAARVLELVFRVDFFSGSDDYTKSRLIDLDYCTKALDFIIDASTKCNFIAAIDLTAVTDLCALHPQLCEQIVSEYPNWWKQTVFEIDRKKRTHPSAAKFEEIAASELKRMSLEDLQEKRLYSGSGIATTVVSTTQRSPDGQGSKDAVVALLNTVVKRVYNGDESFDERVLLQRAMQAKISESMSLPKSSAVKAQSSATAHLSAIDSEDLLSADAVNDRCELLCAFGAANFFAASVNMFNDLGAAASVINSFLFHQKLRRDFAKPSIVRLLCRICNESSPSSPARSAVADRRDAKTDAAVALCRILISTNPILLFDGRAQEVEVAVKPIVRLLGPNHSSLERFEALMALTNIAAVSPHCCVSIFKQGWFMIRDALLANSADAAWLQMASIELICNLSALESTAKALLADPTCDLIMSKLIFDIEAAVDSIDSSSLLNSDSQSESQSQSATPDSLQIKSALAASAALAFLTENEDIALKIMSNRHHLETIAQAAVGTDKALRKRAIAVLDNILVQYGSDGSASRSKLSDYSAEIQGNIQSILELLRQLLHTEAATENTALCLIIDQLNFGTK